MGITKHMGGQLGLIIIQLLILFGLYSCKHTVHEKGYNINKKTQTAVWKLNEEFFTSLISEDYDKIYAVFNDSIVKHQSELLIAVMHSLHYRFVLHDFNYLNQYYQKSIFKRSRIEASFNLPDLHPYTINYKCSNKETMITIATLGDTLNQGCITMIYGKYVKEWKLDYFFFAPLLIEGKDAYDWAIIATEEVKKGHYMNAGLYLKLSFLLYKPSGGIWTYDIEPDLNDKAEFINREVRKRYRFPIRIRSVESKPYIIETKIEIVNDTLFPSIVYQTNFPLSDSISISNECDELNFMAIQYFKHFKNNNNTVFFQALEKYPEDDMPINSRVIRRKLKAD